MRELAQAIRSIFRAQEEQAYGGKERYGDWNFKFADAIEPVIARMYKGKAEGYARERAITIARSVNQTTAEWLQEGRDPRVVFSATRVVTIADTETSTIKNDTKLHRLHGERIKWKIKGDACPDCRSLNGRVVTAGKQNFISKSGVSVPAPPLHPHCNCEVDVV